MGRITAAFLLPVMSLLVFVPAFARVPLKGFVRLANGHELYVEYTPAADPSAPVMVLGNGATWSTENWASFRDKFKQGELGILSYDPVGMGRTRARFGVPDHAILLADQVTDLHLLLQELKISKPWLVGISYGGGLDLLYAATYPNEISGTIVMDPYTAPLTGQDTMVRNAMAAVRMNPFNPLNQLSDTELYDYFLEMLIDNTMWMADPTTLPDYQLVTSSVFRLTQGLHGFYASRYANKFGDQSIYLIAGTLDEYIPQAEFAGFWRSLPAAKRGSWVRVVGGQHAVVSEFPTLLEQIVRRILQGDSAFRTGHQMFINPWFPLPKVSLPKATLADNVCHGIF